jgi:cell division transport system permease protein
MLQGIKNIWRNKVFSLVSIATMSACIFLFGLFFAIVMNFQSVVRDVESGVAITVFFDEGISQEAIDALGTQIDQRHEVSSRVYVSAEEAWRRFAEQYFEGDEGLIESFGGDNPLQGSANFEIYMEDISMQAGLVEYVNSLEGVREVLGSELAANTLVDFNRLIGYISAGIILILLCVAVFLISMTVTTGIAVRKEEIGIMKLIGATDYFVRAPFLIEGILIGFFGAVIPLTRLYFMYSQVVSYIGERFLWLSQMIQLLPVNQVFSTLVPVALILGLGVGFIGSRMTLHRPLRV